MWMKLTTGNESFMPVWISRPSLVKLYDHHPSIPSDPPNLLERRPHNAPDFKRTEQDSALHSLSASHDDKEENLQIKISIRLIKFPSQTRCRWSVGRSPGLLCFLRSFGRDLKPTDEMISAISSNNSTGPPASSGVE